MPGFNFPTSEPTSGEKYWECNLAAIWGQKATGGGMDISAMTKKFFVAIEKRIGDWWWDLVQDSMKQAGAKEKAMVAEKGQMPAAQKSCATVTDTARQCKKPCGCDRYHVATQKAARLM